MGWAWPGRRRRRCGICGGGWARRRCRRCLRRWPGRWPGRACQGCKTIKVPDSKPNRAWLGKMNAVNGETGYPVIQLMTLVETGTRALIGAVFGATATGELDWARKLLHLLDAT